MKVAEFPCQDGRSCRRCGATELGRAIRFARRPIEPA
jgi:hypothetical protein